MILQHRFFSTLFGFAAMLAAPNGFAQTSSSTAGIEIALTNDKVEIDTSFSGAQLTLFGAVNGMENPAEKIDIISVVRGPETNFEIRQLTRNNLIWTPGDAHKIENAPALYLTNATKPITDIAPLPDQAKYRLGANHLGVRAPGSSEENANTAHDLDYEKAFLKENETKGLYRDAVDGVAFKKGSLFAIQVNLPANTPVGDYDVFVYLYQDGALLSRDTATLLVNKVGIERRIYELAHERPVSYGITCVALSLFAGWIAALAFRK
ncbi:MAG: membrane protein [Hyphococcus sp.]|nr:MAG: membrane protein [Marinicaulis sp.]